MAPSAPAPPEGSALLFEESFDDQNMDRFVITDQRGNLLSLTREDGYQPDGRDGFLLERLLTTNSDGRSAENLTSFAQTAVTALQDANRVQVTARILIESPEGGTATFGVGVGQPLLEEPAYAAYLITGYDLFVLGLTRNDGFYEPIVRFPPSEGELVLALLYDRATGEVEASVSQVDGPVLIRSSFMDPGPLRPTVLLFYTRLSTSARSVFQIDDIVVRED